MNRFALVGIQEVKGRIPFKKLVIDGVCQYDEFCKQLRIEGNLDKQLIGILNNMNQVSNLNRLPKNKFRDITPKKETVKEYEFKKGDLRFYVIKEDGHIVIIGGKKSTQKEDLNQFRSIKKRYLESKQKV